MSSHVSIPASVLGHHETTNFGILSIREQRNSHENQDGLLAVKSLVVSIVVHLLRIPRTASSNAPELSNFSASGLRSSIGQLPRNHTVERLS
jgi:hypothetical protein